MAARELVDGERSLQLGAQGDPSLPVPQEMATGAEKGSHGWCPSVHVSLCELCVHKFLILCT